MFLENRFLYIAYLNYIPRGPYLSVCCIYMCIDFYAITYIFGFIATTEMGVVL